MCFSAGASFVASALLGVVGVGGVGAVRKSTRSQVLFAAIPLLFAVQQFTEGLVWLALTRPEYRAWENSAVHAFLFFAEVLWPVWLPLAVLFMEKNPRRRGPLWFLAAMGIGVSLFMAYYLAVYPVITSIASHHVQYQQDLPLAGLWFSGIFYVLPTAVPLFVSSVKGLRIMGVSILASYVVAHLMYPDYVVSVWCYFAALISVEVLLIVRKSTASEDAVLPRARPSY